MLPRLAVEIRQRRPQPRPVAAAIGKKDSPVVQADALAGLGLNAQFARGAERIAAVAADRVAVRTVLTRGGMVDPGDRKDVRSSERNDGLLLME